MGYAEFIGEETVGLTECLGRILAEDIVSDMDVPPFSKSVMDGYACRREDIANELTVIEEISAGTIPQKKIGKNRCAKIMTGAMVPQGADVVIIVEETEILDDNRVKFVGDDTPENIYHRGEDIHKGEIVLRKGERIFPQHIAILAAMGKKRVIVARRPRIAIIATGNEIIEPEFTPKLSQIRNINSYELIAQIAHINAECKYYGIVRDDFHSMDEIFQSAISENDIVLITGGVSMGEYDIVPDVLRKNGVEIIFDRIAVQPGRPSTLGILNNKRIFGVPGNPVSAFVIFEILIKPFLFKIMGHKYEPVNVIMPLSVEIELQKALRDSWIPVKSTEDGYIMPLEYHGSAHFAALADADGLICIPRGTKKLARGTKIKVRLLKCN